MASYLEVYFSIPSQIQTQNHEIYCHIILFLDNFFQLQKLISHVILLNWQSASATPHIISVQPTDVLLRYLMQQQVPLGPPTRWKKGAYFQCIHCSMGHKY